jgi:hypothetical protein
MAIYDQSIGLSNSSTINTGNDDDIIIGTAVIYKNGVIKSGTGIINWGTIDTSDGNDSIISQGIFTNRGNVFLGESNDLITADTDLSDRTFENFNFIGTGDGNDTITSTGVLYNEGVINTGSDNDSIIVDGGVNGSGIGYSIYNNGGAINMGEGNDSIIANEGFESAPNSSGAWFLGEGEDYIKGFGSGDFYGGNGNDTLELTPGTYTVGIWGEGGESPIFTKGNQLMITSEFEKLKAGSTIYDFTSLTAGQIIVVA